MDSSQSVTMLEEERIAQFMQQHFHQEKQDKLERFRHLNRYVQHGQILFVGSSLMEQFPIYEFLQDFDLPCKIYNRGIGGYTTQELLETLDVCVYDLQPAHVFINIGTNDLNGPDYRLDDLIRRYAQILQGIQEHLPDTSIFLLAYYPINTEVGNRNPFISHILQYRTNARIEEANEAVRGLSQRFGARYLDLNEPLRDGRGELKAEYTIEGMHMYANGYQPVMAQLNPILDSLSSARI